MIEILQSKNSATRFQKLVEIAYSCPVIQQKDIAARLRITPQAIRQKYDLSDDIIDIRTAQ